jgi:hypothetical protein
MASRSHRGLPPNVLHPPSSAPGPDFDLSFLPAAETLTAGTAGSVDDLHVPNPMYPAPAHLAEGYAGKMEFFGHEIFVPLFVISPLDSPS